MKFHKKTLLAVALATGPIHLAGCATMIEDNPELVCAMAGVVGGLVGYAIGDDTGAAVAGAAIGALGCALIQHLGTENAKAVERWVEEAMPPEPMDKAFTRRGILPAINDDGTEGGIIIVNLIVSPGDEDTECREVRTGTKIGEKEVVTEAKECLDDNGDYVLVTQPTTTVASI